MAKQNQPIDATVELFHADWCHHCQELLEKWPDIKSKLENNGIKVYEYEQSKFEKKFTDDNVTSFPTIKITINGQTKEEYNGPRTYQGIYNYIIGEKNSDSKFKQCGGSVSSKLSQIDYDDDKYYKIKYLKYKAKYMKLRSKLGF